MLLPLLGSPLTSTMKERVLFSMGTRPQPNVHALNPSSPSCEDGERVRACLRSQVGQGFLKGEENHAF